MAEPARWVWTGPPLFECSRRALSLSEADCARDYKRVKLNGTLAWRSDWHCRGCPQGAIHAGESKPPEPPKPPTCCRCGQRTTRLVYHRLCRSCYNRGSERLRGLNGKGFYPRDIPHLLMFSIAAIIPPSPAILILKIPATGWLEALTGATVEFKRRYKADRWGVVPALSHIDPGRPETQWAELIEPGWPPAVLAYPKQRRPFDCTALSAAGPPVAAVTR